MSTGKNIVSCSVCQLALSFPIPYNYRYMKLFSLFTSQYYKPTWIYAVDSHLWRILFSHGDLVAGEHRDNDKKQVTFFCIDSRSGEEKWNIRKAEEGWWTTTEGVYGNKLYLHAFAKPDLPQPKHVTSIDMKNGSVLWDHPDLTFLYVKDDMVVVERKEFEITRYHRLDTETGKILDTIYDRHIIDDELSEARANDPHTLLMFPDVYNPGLQDHELFTRIVSEKQTRERILDPIEVMQFGDNLIVCYHRVKDERSEGSPVLVHELCIHNKANLKEVYSDVLMDNASAPVPDGFFIRENVLYYIRNRNQLLAITLRDTL